MKPVATTVIPLPASRPLRLLAAAVDHMLITGIAALLGSLLMGPDLADGSPTLSIALAFSAAVLLYLCRDCVRGTSPGKFVMGLAVREAKDPSRTPPPGRLVLRNLTTPIWPVEVILLLVSPDRRRAGDHLAGTEVIQNPAYQRGPGFVLAGLGALGFGGITATVVLVMSLIKQSEPYRLSVAEISRSAEVREATGGIRGYGWFPQGGYSVRDGRGDAGFLVKVIGDRRDLRVRTRLQKEPDREWRLTSLEIER